MIRSSGSQANFMICRGLMTLAGEPFRMQVNCHRLAQVILWLAATGLVMLFEAQMIWNRARSVSMAASNRTADFECHAESRRNARDGANLRLGTTDQQHRSVILVVGSMGAPLDGEFAVNLRIERIEATSQARCNSHGPFDASVPDHCRFDARRDRLSAGRHMPSELRPAVDRSAPPQPLPQ